MINRITIAGGGYVGLSLATLLSQNTEVVILDIDSNKVDMINRRIPTIEEPMIKEFFETKDLKLSATTNKEEAYKNTDLVIVATPTNYDEVTNYFDTSSIDDVIINLKKVNNDAPVFIKSTIPIGFVNSMRRKYNKDNIYFSPEFLREGSSLKDNLYPSRIIVGGRDNISEEFAQLLKDAALNDPEVIFMGPNEAESVKLFANNYLAMRVAYFNELDNFAKTNHLNSEKIIKGISLDPRIGDYYNNPSFGYGGYCLPKDSKQLKANFDRTHTPYNLISAIVESNKTRKDFITEDILSLNTESVGIYRLIMKSGSDNFRESAIFDIIKNLKCKRKIYIYEPATIVAEIEGCKVIKDFDEFIELSDVIVTNRMADELKSVNKEIYTRDIFEEN